MPRIAKELTAIEISRLTTGFHAVGSGLYIEAKESGAKSWILRITVGKKRRNIGLGAYPATPLKEAREKARKAREMIEAGLDPVEHKKTLKEALIKQQENEITFRQCAIAFLEAHSDEWRYSTLKENDRMLRLHAYPVIGGMFVRDVDQSAVLKTLQPIWKSKTVTATRLRNRIENVLDWAAVRGYRSADNPARWKGHLNKLLANPEKIYTRRNHEALAHEKIPAFMKELHEKEAVSARCLEFLILNACRLSEARNATWQEIDFDNRIWTIPAARMKAGKDHQIPLSDQSMALLEFMRLFQGGQYIFFSVREDKSVSGEATLQLCQSIEPGITIHGFRSTFRDWVFDCTDYSRELAEMSLAHTVGGAVENAYRRSKGLEKRRPLMQAWANFCIEEMKMGTDGNRVYMRVKEAAKYFAVSTDIMWKWAREREGFPKPIKMGERVTLFDVTAIEEWMRGEQ